MDFVVVRSNLVEALESAFEENVIHADLREDIRQALRAPGKLLVPVSDTSTPGYWSLLPMAIVTYHQPTFARGPLLSLGLTCECVLCALDIFDEVEDDDDSTMRQHWGDARSLMVATTLLSLAQRIFSRCLQQVDLVPERLLSIQQIYTSSLLRAMEGQHKDICSTWYPFATHTEHECVAALEEAYHVAEAKSGMLFQLVCRLACLIAAPSYDEWWSRIGLFAGIGAQLENDASDLEASVFGQESGKSRKSDIDLAKHTFPLVLLSQRLLLDLDLQQTLSSADQGTYGDGDWGQSRVQRACRDAITATRIAARTCRDQENADVHLLENRTGVALSPSLQRLLGI